MLKLRLLPGLLLLLLLALPCAVQAQSNYPPLQGAVADGTGLLNVPDVQAAADRLSQTTGATVIALAIADKGGLAIDPYVDGFLEQHGFGSRAGKSLRSDLIALVIDFEAGKIYTWYGENYTQALNLSIQKIQDEMVPVLQNNATDGFVAGFDKIGAAVYAFRNPPAPPVVNQTVDTSGVGNAILTGLIYLVVIGLVIGGGWLFITKGLPLLKGQTSLTTRALKLRREVNDALSNLFANLPMEPEKNPNMGILLLYASNPDELRKQYTQRQGKLVPLQEEAERLNDLPVDHTVEQNNLKNLIASYEGLLGKIQDIQSWLQSIDEQSTQQASQHATA